MSEWLPIETAPKDRPILLPDKVGGFCVPRLAMWRQCPLFGALLGNDGYAWRPFGDPQRAMRPTHWMPPLNPPPVEGRVP